jgi:KGK domain
MTDRPNQIIPDSNSVVRCLDPEMIEILDSHGTFIVSEILEKIKEPVNPIFSREKIYNIFDQSRTRGRYSKDAYYNDLNDAIIQNDTNTSTIINMLMNGTDCNLLQPDGKGWQKGKLKICFEFIPEESDVVVPQTKVAEINSSPLDEIRQLSNQIASVGSIEQN